MNKLKIMCAALLAAIAIIMLAGCLQSEGEGVPPAFAAGYESLDEPEQDCDDLIAAILEMTGISADGIQTLTEQGMDLRRWYNELQFGDLAQRIHENHAVGASGEVVALHYRGMVYFNDEGILTVQVLAAAFDHAPSATAIAEMQDLGIIVYEVIFSEQQLRSAFNAITRDFDAAMSAGGNSFSVHTDNTVNTRLYPYSAEQIAIFTDFLLELGIAPAMVSFHPAVDEAFMQRRYELVAAALNAESAYVLGAFGDVGVSRTEITFQVVNPHSQTFYHGSEWDMAVYEYGTWRPVQHLVGRVATAWTQPLWIVQSNNRHDFDINRGDNWDWRFGELPPGRYAFIRDGWFGHGRRDTEGNTTGFIVVEFEITGNTPLRLLED